MKAHGDYESVNLATGVKERRISGDGESYRCCDEIRLGPRGPMDEEILAGNEAIEKIISEARRRKMLDQIIRNAILDTIAKEVYGWHREYILQIAGFATEDMPGYGQDDNAPDEAERENLCQRIISEAAKAIERLKDPIPRCPHDYKEVRSGWGTDLVIKCVCDNCGHRSWEREEQLSVEKQSAAGAGI